MTVPASRIVPGPKPRFPGELVLRLRLHTLEFLTEVARDYGDVVTFGIAGSSYFLVNDPDLIRDVLVRRADDFIKGPALRRARSTLGDGLLTSEGDSHRRQRALAQPAFHTGRMPRYAAAMTAAAERTAARWKDGQRVDLHAEMMRLTLEIVAKTLFDADVSDEVQEIGRAMDVTVNMFSRTMSPWGPLMNRLPLPGNFRFRRAAGLLRSTVQRFIYERRAAGEDRGDLLSRLITARDAEGGPGFSDDLLCDELLTIFTAGHETTANALTFAFHLLSQFPDAEANLHAELDAVLAGRAPEMADVERLAYTRMVLAEAMRLFPPAWALGREATREVALEGMTIPRGGVVLMSQWVTHRDSRWWPDPERFDPGRFAPEPSAARPRWAYYPFGGGPRQCIGESFAWTEAILVLATLARKWRVRSTDSRPLRLRPTITLRPRDGVPVVLVRRDR